MIIYLLLRPVSCFTVNHVLPVSRLSQYCVALQVCDWLCMVIDAHFQQLVLSQDARRPIIELHDVVEKRVTTQFCF